MNETITLPQLAELITSATSVTSEVATDFVKAFFAHIEDALVVTDSITIDGFGYFIRNSDPENPVKFIPAEEFSSVLNQPFAMFIPIAVGDADLSEDTVENNPSESSSRMIKMPTDTSDTIAESTPDTQTEQSPNGEVINSAIETPISSYDSSESSDDIPEQFDPVNKKTSVSSSYDYDDYYPPRKRYGIVWLIILFLLGLITGSIIGYFGHDKLSILFGTKEIKSIDIESSNKSFSLPVQQDTLILADSISDTINIISTGVSQPEIYDTVTPNHFLTTMARQYYGPMEYWVFIYEANSDHLGHPNKIKPGTRIIIPDLSTFANGETDEQIMQRARQMGAEIYRRFE